MSESLAEVPASPTELRDWLRRLKAQSGASFAEIARSIGEEERTVKRWMPENGESVVPRGDALLKLLDFFDVQITPPPPEASRSLAGELRLLRNEIVHRSGPGLPPRARIIVEGLATGLSTEEVAASLGITEDALNDELEAEVGRWTQELWAHRAQENRPQVDRLAELEAKVEAQGASMTTALKALTAGIRKLERRLAAEDPPATGKVRR